MLEVDLETEEDESIFLLVFVVEILEYERDIAVSWLVWTNKAPIITNVVPHAIKPTNNNIFFLVISILSFLINKILHD